MIEAKFISPVEGYYWPRSLGGVPRVGDYVTGVTSWSADAQRITLRVLRVTHCAGGEGWTPSVEVLLGRDTLGEL